MLGFGLMAVGIILIVIALLIAFTGLVGMVMGAIGVAIRSIFDALYHVFNKTRIDDDYIAYREERKKAEAAQKLAKEMKEKQERADKAVNALTFSVNKRMNDLKAMYPLADKELFVKFMDTYTMKTVKEADDVAEEIRKQHEQRMIANNGRTVSDYNNADLTKYNVMVSDGVETLKSTIYVNGFTYIVETIDGDTKNIFTTDNKQIALYMVREMKAKRLSKRQMHVFGGSDTAMLSMKDMDDVVIEVSSMI